MLIETERLIITEFEEDMAQAVHENSLDEDTRKFLPDEVFETVDEAKETIEFLMSQYGTEDGPLVYPILNKDGSNIGYVQLVPIDEGWEIGYHVGKKFTGNGYATEAVKAFMPVIASAKSIGEIYGICVAENVASVKVMEKCGFESVYSGIGEYQGEKREIVKMVWEKTPAIRLVEPGMEYADDIWDFRAEVLEFDEDNEDIFAGCLSLDTSESAEEWIKICSLRKSPETCKSVGTDVPSDMYLAVRQSDNRIVGIIDLRHHIDHPILGTWGGHSGYTVRPSERGKGYAKLMLHENLQKAKARGIDKFLVTCNDRNIASEKTIIANGGVYESTLDVNGTGIKRFWITLE